MLSRLAPLIDTLPSHLRLRKVLTGPASRSRARLRYLDLGDCVVRLRGGGGEGLSLVLAADPPVPLERYDDLIATLGNGYRTTVFEMPGFGASLARIGFRFSMASAVASVARLLAAATRRRPNSTWSSPMWVPTRSRSSRSSASSPTSASRRPRIWSTAPRSR